MVTETLNYKSNDTKQPHVQPQKAHSFTKFTGHELLQQTRNKARPSQNNKTCWRVATVPHNRRQCVPAGMPWPNITMSINMCGIKACQIFMSNVSDTWRLSHQNPKFKSQRSQPWDCSQCTWDAQLCLVKPFFLEAAGLLHQRCEGNQAHQATTC